MFLRYIHSFRALAIILVVAAHCITLFDWGRTGWPYQLVVSVMPNCTVFFVFIAGFLFQHLKEETGNEDDHSPGCGSAPAGSPVTSSPSSPPSPWRHRSTTSVPTANSAGATSGAAPS